MHGSDSGDTISAISTPIGEGGIGIVRISGPRSLEIAGKIFLSKENTPPSKFKSYTVHYGHIASKVSKRQGAKAPKSVKTHDEIVDEVILTVMRAPKSYTREDVVEINCHGGIQAVKKVLELVLKYGARLAQPGEFTKRAFLNGRIDLTQAEAVLDVIRAKTEGSLKVAAGQLEGGLSKTVDALRQKLINIASQVEASIDFPDEELDIIKDADVAKEAKKILAELKKLIDTFSEGVVLREGVLAIICGKPNVGKSSLMNLLLKRDRVIVSPVPGTTRDAVEETINLKNIPIRLVDTAGISKAKDAVEKEGIKRSKQYLELADIAFVMLDGSVKMDRHDLDIIKLVGNKRKLVILNKIDLAKKINGKEIRKMFKDDPIIEISVEKKKNINTLERAIVKMIWSGGYSQSEGAIVSNMRHKELLDKTYDCMLSVNKALKDLAGPEIIAVDLKEAIFNLGLIIGKSVSDDILDRIFDRFCIGK